MSSQPTTSPSNMKVFAPEDIRALQALKLMSPATSSGLVTMFVRLLRADSLSENSLMRDKVQRLNSPELQLIEIPLALGTSAHFMYLGFNETTAKKLLRVYTEQEGLREFGLREFGLREFEESVTDVIREHVEDKFNKAGNLSLRRVRAKLLEALGVNEELKAIAIDMDFMMELQLMAHIESHNRDLRKCLSMSKQCIKKRIPKFHAWFKAMKINTWLATSNDLDPEKMEKITARLASYEEIIAEQSQDITSATDGYINTNTVSPALQIVPKLKHHPRTGQPLCIRTRPLRSRRRGPIML